MHPKTIQLCWAVFYALFAIIGGMAIALNPIYVTFYTMMVIANLLAMNIHLRQAMGITETT